MFRLFIIKKLFVDGVEAVDMCSRACHEDGRVGGDNKLGMPCLRHIPEKGKRLQLGLGRKGCFGLIQKVI